MSNIFLCSSHLSLRSCLAGTSGLIHFTSKLLSESQIKETGETGMSIVDSQCMNCYYSNVDHDYAGEDEKRHRMLNLDNEVLFAVGCLSS